MRCISSFSDWKRDSLTQNSFWGVFVRSRNRGYLNNLAVPTRIYQFRLSGRCWESMTPRVAWRRRWETSFMTVSDVIIGFEVQRFLLFSSMILSPKSSQRPYDPTVVKRSGCPVVQGTSFHSVQVCSEYRKICMCVHINTSQVVLLGGKLPKHETEKHGGIKLQSLWIHLLQSL